MLCLVCMAPFPAEEFASLSAQHGLCFLSSCCLLAPLRVDYVVGDGGFCHREQCRAVDPVDGGKKATPMTFRNWMPPVFSGIGP